MVWSLKVKTVHRRQKGKQGHAPNNLEDPSPHSSEGNEPVHRIFKRI